MTSPAPSSPAKLAPARLASGVGRLQRLQRLQRYELWLVGALALLLLVPGLWSYTLVDPWETHYGEVARRMLADDDLVQMKWQHENFDSKPVLTFWLMAAGLEATSVATDGGYSGELATSTVANFAIRIPFVLFGVFGLMITWWMLARLVNRRVAWLAFALLATTPYYVLVARQGITDMPMVACLMGAVACIALVVAREDGPLEPVVGRLHAWHLFGGFLILAVGGQLLYFAVHFANHPELAPGLRLPAIDLWTDDRGQVVQLGGPLLVLVLPFTIIFAALLAASTVWAPMRVTRRHSVAIMWLFALMGVSILGKGPPAAAIIVLIALCYVAIARRWDLLKSGAMWIDIARGVVVMALITLPWHIAIFFKQGLRWVNVYLRTHIMQRAFKGVHGDRGTFDYYVSQLGIGMWPWAALLPGALATVLVTGMARTRESSVRTLAGTWAIVSFALFSVVQTKFHHYMLPAVPALIILIAFFLDDLMRGKIRRCAAFMVFAAGITLMILRDLVWEQKQLIELFVYRHDRAWPSAEPWNVDLTAPLMIFGVSFAILFIALAFESVRRYVIGLLIALGIAFSVWAMNGYMGAAAPHWGQQALHQVYYAKRNIHGIETEYYSLRDLYDDWAETRRTTVRSVIPETMQVGQPATVTIRVPGAGIPGDRVVMHGKVARLGDDEFDIEISNAEHDKLAALLERGAKSSPSRRRPVSQVDADRLIAWQLNWRGENFWSGGEIWGPFRETHTVFMKTDNVEFLEYLKTDAIKGRRYFVITEAQRAKNLKPILPTPEAKKTFEILDTSNNKFTLLTFVY